MASDTGKTTGGGKTRRTGKPDDGKSPGPEVTPETVPDASTPPNPDWTYEAGDAPVEKREQPEADTTEETGADDAPAPENMFSDAPDQDKAAGTGGEADPLAGPEAARADPFADDPTTAPRNEDVAAGSTGTPRADDSAEHGPVAEEPARPEGTADPEPAQPELAQPEPAEPALSEPEPAERIASGPAERAQPAPAPPPPPQRSGGFVAPFLGGILAAMIGYGVAIYGWSTDLNLPFLPARDDGAAAVLSVARSEFSATSEAQAAEIAALQDEIAALRAEAVPADGAAIEARLEDLSAALADVEARLSEATGGADDSALATLRDRIAALEDRPAAEGTPAEAAELAALRDAVAGLQDQVAELSAETAEAAAAAAAAEQAAEAELAARAEQAEEEARGATARAALAQLSAALDTGAPLTPALEAVDAAGLTTPEPLSAARDGVPTLAALQAAYPDAAREALAAAHDADDPADPLDRVGSFLRAQLQVRSLSPREGDDADAILSRAEAALREGDLATAVAEVEALPEPAQPAMADWLADARARLAAVEAADTLAAEIDPQ
jgi:hypothetical protein